MTARIQALTVALDMDIREDDLAPIIAAIEMIKHVAAVTTHSVDPSSFAVSIRVRHQITERVLEALRDPSDG